MVRVIIGILLGAIGSILITNMHLDRRVDTISPVSSWFERPLEKYRIDELARHIVPSQIVLDSPVATTSSYTAWTFHYRMEDKNITGLAHVPTGAGPFPVIVQFRGYVDRAHYSPGTGTKRSAEVFAANGFLSLAPDFLGYGGSDMPSGNVFEERFQTHAAALTLLVSVDSLSIADGSRVGIWGHSNGGQIALTVLEMSERSYPTVLWAPVTKPFPYSILYYTDEADDRGKLLRKKLAEFESAYDADAYSLASYIDRIHGPLVLHQGTADDAVPYSWSDQFTALLKERGGDVTYYSYPGADHNMMPSWSTVISRDIAFFRLRLGERK